MQLPKVALNATAGHKIVQRIEGGRNIDFGRDSIQAQFVTYFPSQLPNIPVVNLPKSSTNTGIMEENKEPSKSAAKKAEKAAKMAAAKAEKAAKQTTLPVGQGKKKEGGGEDQIGITVKKEENFAEWYQEVVLKAQMVEYCSSSPMKTPVS